MSKTKAKPAVSEPITENDRSAVWDALCKATAPMDAGAVSILAHVSDDQARKMLAEMLERGMITDRPWRGTPSGLGPVYMAQDRLRGCALSVARAMAADGRLAATAGGKGIRYQRAQMNGGAADDAIDPEPPSAEGELPARKATNQAGNSAGEVMEIALHRIHPNPNNPRKVFDEEGIAELAESIRERGLLQPLVVMRQDDLKPGAGAQYLLIAGERRYRAMHNLHAEHAPDFARVWAKVVTATEIEALEMALIENLARRDINVIEQARGFRQLMGLSEAAGGHLSQREIARRVGCSQPTIGNALKLLDLPTDAQEYVSAGKLSQKHGLAIGRFSKWPKVQTELARRVVKDAAEGRHIPAERLEGDPHSVVKLIISTDSDAAIMLNRAGGDTIRNICEHCPYDAFLRSEQPWESPICLKPEHWRELVAEVEADRAARAAEAKAKLDAQRAVMEAGQETAQTPGPSHRVHGDPSEWRAAFAGNDATGTDEDEEAALEEDGIAIVGGALAHDDALAFIDACMAATPIGGMAGDVMPQVDDLPHDSYTMLWQRDICDASCPCYRQALRGETVVNICMDPERHRRRCKASAAADQKSAKQALEAARASCAENLKRGDHPEVIRRAAVLLAAPTGAGQLARAERRQAAEEIGIELPPWDTDDHRSLTGYEQMEQMFDALLALDPADLIRLAVMDTIKEDIKNTERGYASRAVRAEWFGRALPETPVEEPPADSDDRARALGLEVNEKLRERNAELMQEILKLKGVIRRQHEVDQADVSEHEDIKRQRDKLQMDLANLTIRNRASEAENATLREQVRTFLQEGASGNGQPAETKAGKAKVNAAKDPELQAEINRQHGEITRLKTELLAAQTEAKQARDGGGRTVWNDHSGNDPKFPESDAVHLAPATPEPEKRALFAVGQRVRVVNDGPWAGCGAVVVEITEGGNYRVRMDMQDGTPAPKKAKAIFAIARSLVAETAADTEEAPA